MADDGTPFYMPALWPFAHIYTALKRSKDDKPPKPVGLPYLDLMTILTAFIAASRSVALAALCIYYQPLLQGREYAAFGDAKNWSLDWVLPIFIRNVVATWIICGFWDWFLYFSPLREKLHKYKINHIYPSMVQMKHDAFHTTSASCWASLIEIVLCHYWATGFFQMEKNFDERFVINMFITVLISHIRLIHFYVIHRLMHPWKTTQIPDVGKFLYRHVHSLHHKSYNPTAFSGTSMHPVEATLYYSAAFIPVAFGLHPVFAIAIIVDCGTGAWLGHDGFQWPGSGDYFHMLHHKHFDGNYGSMHVPLDWLFGTFISCKEDVKKVWGRIPAGENDNKTSVHESSKNPDKVD